MQVYFIKATYTNNVYKISDFWFNSTTPNINVNKMLNINFKADDGLTSFITSQLELPDETSIRDYTHIYVTDYDTILKFYKIISIDYMNKEQWMITVDEDPFIANYQTLKSEDLIITRSNDDGEFRGVNDIADMTLKEDTTTVMINSDFKTGKWALLFFQLNQDDNYIGLKFETYSLFGTEKFNLLSGLTAMYPEVNTDSPEEYSYFQKFAYVGSQRYQCVYDGSGVNSRLRWVEIDNYQPLTGDEVLYLRVNNPTAGGVRTNLNDFFTVVIAMPIEADLVSEDSRPILSYNSFLGPVDTNLIDIKIVTDIVFKTDSIVYSLTDREMEKTITFTFDGGTNWQLVEEDDGTNTPSGWDVIQIGSMKNDIDVSNTFWSPFTPIYAEPFYKYDLYIYGKKFSIPAYLTDDIHLFIAITSGVCNYFIYYNDPRNILGSGSFTHSVRYSIDQLDAFYSQNPTYKEQFFTKMAIDSVKNVVGGAVAGSVVPGIGTIAGAIGGAVASGVDAGVGLLNLHFQEKGLKLKPDQSFGEISEVALQSKNIFGVYWVMRESENKDLMRSEYDLRGFPTSLIASMEDLTAFSSVLFGGTTKVIFGELKTVIKNEYVTSYINQKLKEGVVLK